MLPSITVTACGQSVVLRLAGEFDLVTRDELEAACRRLEASEATQHVQIDLSGVGYIDCASLRAIALVVLARRALGDPTSLVVTSPFLRHLLEVMGFARPDVIVDRLDEAA